MASILIAMGATHGLREYDINPNRVESSVFKMLDA